MFSRLNFKTLFCAVAFFYSATLFSEVVQILSVDSSNYPRIDLNIAVSSPHPSFIKNEHRAELELFEIYNHSEKKIEITNKVFQKDENSRLNLVVILDATKSISKKSFHNAKKSARKLLLSLKKNDRSAIYVLKGKPHLIADVSSNHASQALKLDAIEHNGKRTRLYDSLYSGLYTARSMASGSQKALRNKTAVVLFTDGRDEGSYLTDNDCFELTELGRSLSIPVYSVLTNPNKLKKDKSKTSNNSTSLLNRLSLKTGGRIWINPKSKDRKKIIEQIHSKKHTIYKITYKSSANNSNVWPGNSILLRSVVNRSESSYSAISSYRIPFSGYLKENFGRSLSIIVGVLMILFILLVALVIIFIFLSRIINKKQTKNERMEAKQDLPAPPDIAPYMEKSLQHTDLGVNKQIAPEQIKNSDDMRSTVVHSTSSFPANSLMDDERKLYMREYNYRLLQLGLREAGQYKKAALITKNNKTTGGQKQYDLFLKSTVIGSGRWANIPVHDNTISPIHAKLKRVNDSYVIYDMLSAGGVYVNGKKILRPRGLKDNDEIRIGRTKFYFKETT